jgi:hypothetical protein
MTWNARFGTEINVEDSERHDPLATRTHNLLFDPKRCGIGIKRITPR